MNTINSIIIEGNLVRDPVLNITPNGTSICSFSLASNRNYVRNNEKINEVSFFTIETWADMARQCASVGRKGRGVRVVGRLKQDRWKDAEGKSYSRIKIVADNVAFKPAKQNSENVQTSLEKAAVAQEEVAEAVAF